jgi:hypothetical protein
MSVNKKLKQLDIALEQIDGERRMNLDRKRRVAEVLNRGNGREK